MSLLHFCAASISSRDSWYCNRTHIKHILWTLHIQNPTSKTLKHLPWHQKYANKTWPTFEQKCKILVPNVHAPLRYSYRISILSASEDCSISRRGSLASFSCSHIQNLLARRSDVYPDINEMQTRHDQLLSRNATFLYQSLTVAFPSNSILSTSEDWHQQPQN